MSELSQSVADRARTYWLLAGNVALLGLELPVGLSTLDSTCVRDGAVYRHKVHIVAHHPFAK